MGYYWYENEPELYQAEYQMMKEQFPQFSIYQMNDGSGRLYWQGKVQPSGPDGGVWELQLIYKNNHPHTGAREWGGSVQILPVNPNLEDLTKRLGRNLPHVYYDSTFGRNGRGQLFICTADPRYVKTDGMEQVGGAVTSAASSCAWACKWIVLFELWLNGVVNDDLFEEGVY